MNTIWNPTGASYSIGAGDSSASVTEVGAFLRSLVIDGVRVLQGFEEDAAPRSSQGAVLVPWPNRVRDGRWTWNGAVQQLDLSEPKLLNASHGFVRTLPHVVTARDASSITLSVDIHPQRGYPFSLRSEVRYALTDAGLETSHALTNFGREAAPAGIGTHGYYRVGETDVDDLVLTSSGTTVIAVDERMNPVGSGPVPAEKDLRSGRVVRDLVLDDAYTDLEPVAHDDGRRVEHVLTAPDGASVTVWGDEQFAWAQFYTSSTVPGDGSRALAIEPMTMPADALNSGDGVRWIGPGQRWAARWGVSYSAA